MKIKYFFSISLFSIIICSCNYSRKEKKYNAGIDSIKSQLDTLLGSEGGKIDSLANIGILKSRDSTDYYYFLLYRASTKLWRNNYAGFDSLLLKFKRYSSYAKSSPKLDDIFAKYYVLKGNASMLNFTFNDALKNYKKAYSYQEKGANKLYRTTILANLSDCYLSISDYAKGASCLRKVLLICDSLNNNEKKVSALCGLARIYTGLGNYQEANKYFIEAEKYIHYIHGREIFLFYNSRGNYYFYKGDYKKTIQVFKKMNANLNYITNTDFDRNIVWLNLADAYIRIGQIDSAKIYQNKCRNFFIKNNNKSALYYLDTQNIAILLKENNLKKVAKFLYKKTSPSVECQMICLRYKYLVDYYTRIKDDHNALIYMKRLIHITDSVKNETQKLATAESAFRYQQDSKTLNLKLDLSKSEEHYRTSQLLLALSAFIILLLILAYRSIYKYNKNRRIQIMKEAKKRILKLRMEELRNRVSPHFIFNVLNYEIYNREHGNKETNINCLVRLIRTGLEQSDEISVPLYKELDFIDGYVELQRHSLSKEFVYNLEISDGVDDNTLIPSMIIQTAVENAIKHGLRGLEGKTILNIDIRKINDLIQIMVTDNGRGLIASKSKDDSTGTGMAVIRETLKILNEYNSKKIIYEMNINPIGKGCIVRIIIPLQFDYSL